MELSRLVIGHAEIFGCVAAASCALMAFQNAASALAIRVRRRKPLRRQGSPVVSLLPRVVDLPARTRPARNFGRVLSGVATCLAGAGILVAETSARAEEWASFQNGGHVSLPSGSAPNEWSPTSGITWRAAITGEGQSSPIIRDGQIYVTSSSGPNKEAYHVSAFAFATGEKLWQHDLVNPTPQENGGYVSVAAPTPAADVDGVICFFEGGNLIALSPKGDVRWERNLVEDYGPITARHGLAASVEQSETSAFLWVERQDDPYVLCVEKSTGKTLWKVAGLNTTSWASPRLMDVGDAKHLVLSGVGFLVGLDIATGDRLWTLDGIKGNSTPTPVPVANAKFLVGATEGRGEAAVGDSGPANGLVEVVKTDEGSWKAQYVWRAKRATSSFGSPIAAGNTAYFINRVGVIYAADLATGAEHYAQRLGDSAWATPLAIGDRVFVFGKGGGATVIATGDTFQQLAENTCWVAEEKPATEAPAEGAAPGASGPVLYGVAYADGLLVIRKGDELICVGAAK